MNAKKGNQQQENLTTIHQKGCNKGAKPLFLSFVIKEMRHIFRDKHTLLILFGMPIILMFLFGFALSIEVRNIRTVVVTSSMDNQTQAMVEALRVSEYFKITHCVATPTEAERLMRNQEADMAVTFSQNFANKQGGIQLITDGTDPNMGQQYSNLATRILQQHLTSKQLKGKSPTLSASPVSIKLLYNPQMKSAYNFVPGTMGLLLILICTIMTSISIVREKERGTMEVLLVSPIRPILIIVAKAVPYMLVSFGILSIILFMARFVLNVPLAGSIFWIVTISAVYIIMSLALGLLISTIAETQIVALLMSAMLLLMPSMLLSGMMFPIESMPDALQWISVIMPPRYYISAMRKLMIMGVGLESILNELAMLLGMMTFFLFIALKKFKTRLE